MADARTPQEAIADRLHAARNPHLHVRGIPATAPIRGLAKLAIDALEAEGYVIVACPVGERRVVDRTPQPCPECKGDGRTIVPPYDALDDIPGVKYFVPCEPCGGQGTVDSDRVLRQKRHEPASRKNPETWVDLPDEAEAMRRYRNALDSGLSDHEAREEAWPSVVQPSPQTS